MVAKWSECYFLLAGLLAAGRAAKVWQLISCVVVLLWTAHSPVARGWGKLQLCMRTGRVPGGGRSLMPELCSLERPGAAVDILALVALHLEHAVVRACVMPSPFLALSCDSGLRLYLVVTTC